MSRTAGAGGSRTDRRAGRSPAAIALRRAAGDRQPNIGRLVDAVPAMLAEAHRRRRIESDPAVRVSSAARFWLPRLAAVTAVLVLAAFLWPRGTVHSAGVSNTGAATENASLENWVMTGSSGSGFSDPVMDALVR